MVTRLFSLKHYYVSLYIVFIISGFPNQKCQFYSWVFVEFEKILPWCPSIYFVSNTRMCSRKSNALLQFYVLTLFIGFLCNFFATILPFWFAKYPGANTRFLRLGLFEICLEEFISPLDQQRVYTGCFYIFDKKISPLWPLVFAGILNSTL